MVVFRAKCMLEATHEQRGRLVYIYTILSEQAQLSYCRNNWTNWVLSKLSC